MKQFIRLTLLLFALLTTACSAALSTETRPPESTNEPTEVPRATPTTEIQATQATQPGVPYPGLPPTAIPAPEGYPAASQQIPADDAYPDATKTVWVLHPLGVQCEGAAESKYKDEQAVAATLTAAGITVQEVTTTNLMVCQACGCPTSIHYRVQIPAIDLKKALSLGWVSE
jgi:hypothetical protein